MTDDTDYGFNITTDKIKEINPPQFYKIDLNSMKTQTHPTESQINIYTDGSLTEKHAGSGYTIQHKKKEILAESIRLPLHTTVFQAEIIAINEACKAFLDKRHSNMQFIKSSQTPKHLYKH